MFVTRGHIFEAWGVILGALGLVASRLKFAGPQVSFGPCASSFLRLRPLWLKLAGAQVFFGPCASTS